MLLFLYLLAGKPTHTVNTKGENINICWSPNGHTIAVGNKVHIHIVYYYYVHIYMLMWLAWFDINDFDIVGRFAELCGC